MLKEQGSMEQKAQNALKEAASLFEKEASFLKRGKKDRRGPTGRFGMFNIGIDFGSTYTTVSAYRNETENWKP